MSNLLDHARRELEAAGWFKPDGMYDGMVGPAVMALVELFAEQGHSGMSASIVRALFHAVANFDPIGPLTGDDMEWNEVAPGLYQNNRCSHVFKENGQAYDSTGRIFRTPSGTRYTNRESRVPVTFPYTPKVEYVDVQE